ncbi:transketolase-like TK C-terminal-containing protein [Streptomyces sp. NBC_00448]|uniref:transketolase-like TK C-terminal-containing protein n=1 Tax=Streptomyces sp. NBC_00448 TaxID=2903652 RepID=UPI003FA77811
MVLATGSEIAVAVTAVRLLAGEGVLARVVSMPCREWFDEQPASYQDSVIPPAVRRRISVETGVRQGRHDLLGLDGRAIGRSGWGTSARRPRPPSSSRTSGSPRGAVADPPIRRDGGGERRAASRRTGGPPIRRTTGAGRWPRAPRRWCSRPGRRPGSPSRADAGAAGAG